MMNIRKALVSDAIQIAKVHVDSWKKTYENILPKDYLSTLSYENRQKMWEQAIPNGHVFVAENADGTIVGFSTGGKERSGKYTGYEGELYAIYILKEYQQQGLGKLLVQAVINHLKAIKLKTIVVLVLEDNPSCLFYEALGGKPIDTLEVEIAGEKLNELVYGWEDIEKIVWST